MFSIVLERLFTHVPWILILLGLIIKARRSCQPTTCVQIIGASILSLWAVGNLIVGIILWGEPLHPDWLHTWIVVQRVALPLGMSLLGIGFFLDCLKSGSSPRSSSEVGSPEGERKGADEAKDGLKDSRK